MNRSYDPRVILCTREDLYLSRLGERHSSRFKGQRPSSVGTNADWLCMGSTGGKRNDRPLGIYLCTRGAFKCQTLISRDGLKLLTMQGLQ